MREGGISDEELAAIKERTEQATPGPWTNHEEEVVGQEVVDPAGRTLVDVRGDHEEADAEFIAHAREDVPALLAEIERLRALLHEVADYEDDLTTGPWPRVWAELEGRTLEQGR
jgi:hypothetical protein